MDNEAHQIRRVPIFAASETLDELESEFFRRYNMKPSFFVVVPGRVNLIGEHIDYMGFHVLPFSLNRSIKIAVSYGKKNTHPFEIINAENCDEIYKSAYVQCDPSITIDSNGTSSWVKYIHCGYKGIFDFAAENNLLPETDVAGLKSLNLLVSSNCPAACGLSTSSALVVGSALLTLHLLDLDLPLNSIASICARSERYIGTMGGGMDQAACLCSEEHCASLIDFYPKLNISRVRLPRTAAFVVCHSMTTAKKSEETKLLFNKRVVECRLAAYLLSKHLEVTSWTSVKTLRQVWDSAGSKTLAEMSTLSENVLKGNFYTKNDLSEKLECDVHGLFKGEPNALKVLDAYDDFWLRNRALHVYQEAQNVLDFKNECERCTDDTNTLEKLGQLMDSSHKSCRDLYDCSCEALEQLVGAAKEAGAFGSRLTGAGWGGCTVSLVHVLSVDSFIGYMKDNFYRERFSEELVISCQPCGGAAIYLSST